MQSHTLSRPERKHKRRWLAVALFCVIALPATAQEARWMLLPVPAYMRPDFPLPIRGTDRTLVTPALVRGTDFTPLKKDIREKLSLNLDSIRRVSRQSASERLAALEPEIVRDKKGVALFAVLEADSPEVAGTVFAPDFVEKFQDVLGPDLLVAIPNSFRIYVYPALASRFQDTAAMVLRDYEISAYPVSREVFQITPDGLEAVGTFEGDR